MSFEVVALGGVLSGESEVILDDEYGEMEDSSRQRIRIHPWKQGVADRSASEVFVQVGLLERNGAPTYETQDYENAIFDREEFVSAILAVFPELRRANNNKEEK